MLTTSTYSLTNTNTHISMYENGMVQQKCYTIQKVWEAKLVQVRLDSEGARERKRIREKKCSIYTANGNYIRGM